MPAERARIAVLPFDNLTPEAAAGEVLSLVFFTELGARGDWEPVETGVVLAALESLGVRSTGSLGAAQLAAIGERLGVSWLLVGSVLEHGQVRTADGELPSVGVTVKLLDAASGRVLWTRMAFRSGDDGETVFGWGRENSPRKLAARLAGELLRELPAADRRGLAAPAGPAVSARKETP
jgi:TolB-like protein